MEKVIKKMLCSILAGAMVFSSIPADIVNAQEAETAILRSSDVESDDDNNFNLLEDYDEINQDYYVDEPYEEEPEEVPNDCASMKGPYEWGDTKIDQALEELMNVYLKPGTRFTDSETVGAEIYSYMATTKELKAKREKVHPHYINYNVIPVKKLGEKKKNGKALIYGKYPEFGNKTVGTNTTCTAHAMTAFYRIFGDTKYENIEVYSWSKVLETAKKGDWITIKYKGKSGDSSHDILYVKRDTKNGKNLDTATIYDANNWSSACKVCGGKCDSRKAYIHVWSGYSKAGYKFIIHRAKNYSKLDVPTKPCTKHSYEYKLGYTVAKCKNSGCTATYDYKKNPVSSFSKGLYVIDRNVDLYSEPYSVSSKTGWKIGKNNIVYIDAAYKNCVGNIWGHVSSIGSINEGESFLCSTKGFIVIQDYDEKNLKYKKYEANPNISVNVKNINEPETLYSGDSFVLSAVVEATGSTISSIKSYFVSRDGNRFQEKVTAETIGTTSYAIKGSEVDGNLRFNELNPGEYKYVLEVKLASGLEKLFESKLFKVVEAPTPTVPTPAISYVGSFIGGVKYAINNGNNEINYSIDGGESYKKCIGSVTVEITENTTICAWSGEKTNMKKESVTVGKVTEPYISFIQNGDGSAVTITCEGSYSDIYYAIDDGEYEKYNGTFILSEDHTITAYAEKVGMVTSEVSIESVTVACPDVPEISSTTKADIAKGDAITINLNTDAKAKSYVISVAKDGVLWKTINSDTPYVAFNTENAGKYTISASSVNAVGSSDYSDSIVITAHEPVKVTFVDYDDSIIDTPQEVRYGYSATKPLSPKRRGYSFSGWVGKYTDVTEDTIVKADYEINKYIVKFYDVNESKYLGEQEVEFDSSIDKELYKTAVDIENEGRIFAGWEIFDVKDADSVFDVEHVDTNMSVRAVTTWGNKDLPCLIESVTNVPSSVNGKIAFKVTPVISSTDSSDLDAKIIVSLMTKRDDESYRMVATSTKTAIIHSGTNSGLESIDATYDGSVKIDRILVSVVSNEGNGRTGGLIAESKWYDVDAGGLDYYSGWMTAEEAAKKGLSIEGSGVLTQKQYRSRNNNRKTTEYTTSSTAPAGYQLLNSVKNYGNWSAWSDSSVKATATREVETKTVSVPSGYTSYRYGCWTNGAHTIFCPNYGKTKWGGTWTKKYSAWSKTRTKAEMVGTAGNGNFCPYNVYKCTRSTDHIKTTSSHNNSSGQTCDYWQYKYHPTSSGEDYYWEESKYVDTSTTKTQYRYRDITMTYCYYMFVEGQWTAWSEEAVTAIHSTSQDVDVEERTVYNIPIPVPSEDNNGIEKNISGSLDNAELENKNALILVYKEKNTDPTESQLQYVGNINLGENGEYSHSFYTKEEPDYNTGDFVVALAIEGGDNLINVALIRYERPVYKVKYTVDNEVIAEVDVEEGGNAEAPDSVEKEGYDFIGWDRNVTNVMNNMNVVARFKPKEYFVAFVDYENRKVFPSRQEFDSLITVPDEIEIPTCEGFEFKKWNFGENDKVTGDIVIDAVWEAKKFTVNFLDLYGEIIDTQTVEYGKAASLPTLEVDDALEFLGWNEDVQWWNVKSDMNIYPNVVFKDKALSPTSSSDFVIEGDGNVLDLVAEQGATIYYTLDGTEPIIDDSNIDTDESIDAVTAVFEDESEYTSENEYEENGIIYDDEVDSGLTLKYEGPIELTEDCTINAIAVRENAEESAIAEFIYTEESGIDAERGELKCITNEFIELEAGDIVSFDVGFRGVDSIWGAELLIDPGDVELYPLVENNSMQFASDRSFADLGDVNVETVGEAGKTDIRWIGSKALNNPSRMFSISMVVGENVEKAYYPIKLLYASKTCIDADIEKIALEGKVYCSIDNEGSDIVSSNSVGFATVPSMKSIAKKTFEYTGGAVKPNINVYYNGKMLEIGKDYMISYKNNKNIYNDSSYSSAKAPTIVITGKGNFAKKNESIHFMIDYPEKIVPDSSLDSIKGCKIALSSNTAGGQAGYTYTGKEIRPEIEVYRIEGGNKVIIDKKNYLVTYSSNVNAGKASILVTSRKNTSDKIKGSFKILPVELQSSDVKISVEKAEYEYNPKGVTPNISVSVNGIRLVPGKDMIIKCSGNKKTGFASFNVVGKGNYKGTVATLDTNFMIKKADLTKGEMVVLGAAGGESIIKNTKAYVNDTNGYAVAPSNYVLMYEACRQGKSEFVSITDVNEVAHYGDIVRVTAIAKGFSASANGVPSANYTGCISYEYMVADNGILKASLVKRDTGKLVSKDYDGSKKNLLESDIEVSFKDGTHTSFEELKRVNSIKEDGYMIVMYSNNVNKGTASAYVVGCGKYGGLKKVTFKINPKEILTK